MNQQLAQIRLCDALAAEHAEIAANILQMRERQAAIEEVLTANLFYSGKTESKITGQYKIRFQQNVVKDYDQEKIVAAYGKFGADMEPFLRKKYEIAIGKLKECPLDDMRDALAACVTERKTSCKIVIEEA